MITKYGERTMAKGSGNYARKGSGTKYKFKGEMLTIPQIAERYGLNTSVVRDRILKGLPDEEIAKPVRKYSKKYDPNNPLYLQHCGLCTWTPTALDCYDIGADCKRCFLPESVKKHCHMKEKIREIVAKYGKPYDRENNFIEE